MNGVAEPDGQWICVPASNLSNVDYVGGASPGSETLHVKAYDATKATWVGYSSLTAATDVVPAVNVQNVAVAENTSIAAASLIASLSNPSNDSITYYGVDDAGGSGHFTVNGVAKPDGQWIYVPASNLANVDYVGGASPGSDTLNVEVYDATTSTWSASSALTATTYDVAPTVNVQSVSVAENTSIAAASLITSISNPSNDSITYYGSYDAGGNGHFTVNGVAEPANGFMCPRAIWAMSTMSAALRRGATPSRSRFTTPRRRLGRLPARSLPRRPETRSRCNTKASITLPSTTAPTKIRHSLPTLVQTGASYELTLDYGIDA